MNAKYMAPKDLRELIDPHGGFDCTVHTMQIEEIDQRPQLVLYVLEDPRGIIVGRKLYEDLTARYGRCSFADDFFRIHGLQ